MKLVSGPHGYLAQCPDLDATCPSCGQFRSLQAAVVHLEKTVEELTQRVSCGRSRMAVLLVMDAGESLERPRVETWGKVRTSVMTQREELWFIAFD